MSWDDVREVETVLRAAMEAGDTVTARRLAVELDRLTRLARRGEAALPAPAREEQAVRPASGPDAAPTGPRQVGATVPSLAAATEPATGGGGADAENAPSQHAAAPAAELVDHENLAQVIALPDESGPMSTVRAFVLKVLGMDPVKSQFLSAACGSRASGKRTRETFATGALAALQLLSSKGMITADQAVEMQGEVERRMPTRPRRASHRLGLPRPGTEMVQCEVLSEGVMFKVRGVFFRRGIADALRSVLEVHDADAQAGPLLDSRRLPCCPGHSGGPLAGSGMENRARAYARAKNIPEEDLVISVQIWMDASALTERRLYPVRVGILNFDSLYGSVRPLVAMIPYKFSACTRRSSGEWEEISPQGIMSKAQARDLHAAFQNQVKRSVFNEFRELRERGFLVTPRAGGLQRVWPTLESITGDMEERMSLAGALPRFNTSETLRSVTVGLTSGRTDQTAAAAHQPRTREWERGLLARPAHRRAAAESGVSAEWLAASPLVPLERALGIEDIGIQYAPCMLHDVSGIAEAVFKAVVIVFERAQVYNEEGVRRVLAAAGDSVFGTSKQGLAASSSERLLALLRMAPGTAALMVRAQDVWGDPRTWSIHVERMETMLEMVVSLVRVVACALDEAPGLVEGELDAAAKRAVWLLDEGFPRVGLNDVARRLFPSKVQEVLLVVPRFVKQEGQLLSRVSTSAFESDHGTSNFNFLTRSSRRTKDSEGAVIVADAEATASKLLKLSRRAPEAAGAAGAKPVATFRLMLGSSGTVRHAKGREGAGARRFLADSARSALRCVFGVDVDVRPEVFERLDLDGPGTVDVSHGLVARVLPGQRADEALFVERFVVPVRGCTEPAAVAYRLAEADWPAEARQAEGAVAGGREGCKVQRCLLHNGVQLGAFRGLSASTGIALPVGFVRKQSGDVVCVALRMPLAEFEEGSRERRAQTLLGPVGEVWDRARLPGWATDPERYVVIPASDLRFSPTIVPLNRIFPFVFCFRLSAAQLLRRL